MLKSLIDFILNISCDSPLQVADVLQLKLNVNTEHCLEDRV